MNQKGLEPPTHGSGNRCSIQLSYWSIGKLSNSVNYHTIFIKDLQDFSKIFFC